MEQAIANVLRRIFADGMRGDRVAVTISHLALNDPIHIGYSREEKLTVEKIMRSIWKVQQSRKNLNFENNLHFDFSRIRAPVGGKYRDK